MDQWLDFEEWLAFGQEQGYCTEQFCVTHDGIFMSDAEAKEWDAGGDPCAHVVRLGTEKDWL